MDMETFSSRCPKIAEKETRIVKVQNPSWGIEPGHYLFLELFCNDDTCDCRRATIHVVDIDGNNCANISYGWESLEFYTKFMYGDKESAESVVGAQLLLDQPQTDDSNKFLNLFISMVENPAYANRIQSHYDLFKNLEQKTPVKNIDPVDSWIFHREESNTLLEDNKVEFCNVFFLLDGDTGHCFGEVICDNLPTKNNIVELLEKSREKNKGWPKQIFISKKDPYLENFESICEELKIKMVELTPKEIKPLVKDFTESFYLTFR